MVELARFRADAEPVEEEIEIPGPFEPVGDPEFERTELSFRTVALDEPVRYVGC